MDKQNNLVDDEVNFVVPLMIVGIVFVMALLAWGMFMPSADFIF